MSTFVASFEELWGWGPIKRNHLRKMLLIINMTVLHGLEMTLAFEQVPNLRASVRNLWQKLNELCFVPLLQQTTCLPYNPNPCPE